MAGLLATAILVNGCAQRAIIFPERDQSSAQIAKDQAECMAAAKESTDYADLASKGAGTTLVGSIAGAITGAGLGALVGFLAASGSESQNGETAGLIIGGGAGAGAVIGWFVGTGLGLKAAARQSQDRHLHSAWQSAATR